MRAIKAAIKMTVLQSVWTVWHLKNICPYSSSTLRKLFTELSKWQCCKVWGLPGIIKYLFSGIKQLMLAGHTTHAIKLKIENGSAAKRASFGI